MSCYAFIDGFNVYHHLATREEQHGENLKWLSYPDLIGRLAKQSVPANQVYFFTAEPGHLGPIKQKRHALYCQSQELLGVHVIQGRFKKTQLTCKASPCGQFLQYPVNQEKQTDVNIALSLVEQAYKVQSGRFYLVTADTDQIPTAKMVTRLFPNIHFYWVVPQSHRNHLAPVEVQEVINRASNASLLYLRWSHFRKSQMPQIITVNGTTVSSPYAGQVPV